MKEEVKVMEFGRSDEGAAIVALGDLRSKRLAEGKPTATIDALMNRFCSAPTKKRRVRSDETR
jgi:hypothetical protein